MGNIVSANKLNYYVNLSNVNNQNIKDNIKLSDFIKDWAINDYDDGLLYSYDVKKEQPIGEKYTSLLKKRACCTQEKNAPIALPLVRGGIYDDFNFGVISIPIFSPTDDLSKECTRKKIEKTSNNDNSTYYRNYILGGDSTAPDACIQLYGTYNDSSDKSFCNHVLLDRKIMALKYTDNTEEQTYYTSYGRYHNDVNYNRDPYIDCNCKNSVLWENSREKGDYASGVLGKTSENSSSYIKISGDDMSQLLDMKCVNAGNRAYKENTANKIGCLQIQNIIENKYINTNQDNIQNCNLTQAQEADIRKTLPTSKATPELTKSSVPINFFSDDTAETRENSLYIIIVGFIVMLTGIFLFIFRKVIF
jgi:hypothetical protein